MSPNPSVIKEIRSHKMPRALRGWEFPALGDVANAFWLERPHGYTYRFSPVQMRFKSPDLVFDTEAFLKELTTRLQNVLSLTGINRVYGDYLNMVKNIQVVREVLLVETEDISTLYTIIECTPFDDTLREPIYDAQLHILRSIKGNVSIDFYVLNLLELPEYEEKASFIPAYAKLLWKRE